MSTKIAAVTDDGTTISQHFGRATYYAVLTVEDGKIIKREMRDKLGHGHFAGQEKHESEGSLHGLDAEAQERHGRMMAAIQDCQVLLARGMGWGARKSLEAAGIQAIITDVKGVEDAAAAYLAGDIVDHTELLH
ncbi:MAG TPA: NifB/NifX family molybdenum-iron cluster-binding protein [Anaerolineae bacterium]|nr:NifB/NifX family molybdenum-iron cluster-binding protein [Anaerolineae bacterium]